MPDLILITPTWERPARLPFLKRFAATIANQTGLLWLIVEDGEEPASEVQDFLAHTAISHRYWAAGQTKDKGNHQRSAALEYIRENRLVGIVYNADDDNFYHPRLFDELRKVKRIGVFPVGNLGPNGVERPLIANGRVTRWDANCAWRKFPVDMGGFAFCASLLDGVPRPIWTHKGFGGESQFLEKIVGDPEQLEFLCNECRECLVWHNEPLEEGVEYWDGETLHLPTLPEPYKHPLILFLQGSMADQMFQYAFGLRFRQSWEGEFLVTCYRNDAYALGGFGLEYADKFASPLKDDLLICWEDYEEGVVEKMIREMKEENPGHVWLAGGFRDPRFFLPVAEEVRKLFVNGVGPRGSTY